MGVMPWPGFDPATAYTFMTGGAGAAPMHVASAALSTLGGHAATTVAVSAANTAATAEVWSGSGSAAAVASAAQLGGDYAEYGALSVVKSQLLAAAGELHTMTPPQMVTHVQANANRFEYVVDNGINPSVFGALTPRLIDLDTEYFGFMWPNNASAGLRYGAGLDALGAALAGLSALPSMAGGSVAAPAMAAADVAANAGITMASAVMSATEQAATATISPTMSAAETASSLVGQAPLSAPATSPSTPTVSPLANVSSHAPAMPSMGQAQAPAMGMFLPPSTAAVNAPAPAPPVQTMSPVTGSGAAPPGVTSFMKPAEPFKAPPMPSPSGGQATGWSPGMLNASALRGPVTATPTSTAVLTQPLTTSSLATATKPLAYVSPTPLPPTPAPPSQALLEPGTVQTLQPPPTAPQTLPPAPTPPPAAPQSNPPASSSGPNSTGTRGTGIQMLGTGTAGAPQAPSFPPPPLDPSPSVPYPPMPPPSSPGVPPLQRPDVSGWTMPPRAQDATAAKKNLEDLQNAIQYHNENPPDTFDPNAVAAYNSEANYYNYSAAQLEGAVESYNAEYTPASTAQTVEAPNTPSWAHQEPPLPQAPTGQKGTPINVPRANGPATIDGIPFKGHAIDEMQSDGIPFSAVNRALHVGAIEPGKYGRTIFYDAVNNLSVIQDPDGTIITVSYGHLHA